MRKIRNSVRNIEIDGFSDIIIRIFKEDINAKSDPFLTTIMEELENLSEKITTTILQNKILSNLDIFDNLRDEAIKDLGKILEGYTVFPIARKKELAIPLKNIFDKYKKAGITNVNYISESSLIESMLGEFANENLKENIKGLEGVNEAILNIRKAEDDFNKSNDEYLKSSLKEDVAATNYKKSILSLINDKLVPYLNAMVISNNKNCLEFAKNIDAEISHINDIVLNRGKKNTYQNKSSNN